MPWYSGEAAAPCSTRQSSDLRAASNSFGVFSVIRLPGHSPPQVGNMAMSLVVFLKRLGPLHQAADALPESIRPLARIQAFILTDRRWQQDVDQLWRMKEISRVNGPFLEHTPDGVCPDQRIDQDGYECCAINGASELVCFL